MFASQVTDTVTIGDVAVTIRKLSWKSLRSAADKRGEEAIAAMAKAGPAGIEAERMAADRRKAEKDAAIARGEPPAEPTLDQRRKGRYAAYDKAAVLHAGVKSWTAPEKLPAALDDLDEETARRLHEAILDLSLPALEDGAEEADRKND